MEKTSLIKAYISIIAIVLGSTLPTIVSYADQNIVVDPLEINFGEVEIGTQCTAIITIGNIDGQSLLIDEIIFQSGSSPDYEIISVHSLPILVVPMEYIYVEIAFTPSSEGEQTAILEIHSNDPETPEVHVLLTGEGVSQGTPPVSVADILSFYDASVADGTLVGEGPGRSVEGRLNALRNMIEAAGDLIEDGLFEEACQQLMNAYRHCDGLPRPPEFVAGPAAPTLAGMILDLVINLDCE